MSDNNEGQFNLTEPSTLTFPNLLEAKAVQVKGKPSGDPKFSANLEFELTSADLQRAKGVAAKVAAAKWPGRSLGELAFPFSDGNKLADKAKANGKDREFSRNKVVLTARTKYEPLLSVLENNKIVEYTGDARKTAGRAFYTGCQVLAQLNFVAYDGVGNNPDGVTAYLNQVLSLNKGERLTGGSSAAEVFRDYVGTTSAEDPTTGNLADQIPF